jgi:pyrroloquinoline quinone biosynthesis protein E
LLHLRQNYKKLIDSGVNEVQISIDGATKEVFQAIRRGSVYDRVVSNCKLINAYCREQGVRRTKMWVVVQRENRHQLADFVERAHEMGFQDLTFSLSMTDWGQEEWHKRVGELAAEDAFTLALAQRLVARGRELGIAVSFWQVTDKYSTESPDKLCPWPFERGYVSSDLRVVPCCMIANPDASELGSAKSMAETWTSAAYAEFRQAHLDGRIPAVCQGCYRHDRG